MRAVIQLVALVDMLDQRLTFSEARESAQFNLFAKQRIAMMERQFLDQLKLIA